MRVTYAGAAALAVAAAAGSLPPQVAATCKPGPPSLRSEPDLLPPGYYVNQAATGTAPGLLFVTPRGTGNRGNGAAIVNDRGNLHLVWPLTLTLDTTSHTATITRDLGHNPPLHASVLGSNQSLSNGDALVSCGDLPEITEFNSAGKVNFDASLSGCAYRAFRAPWTGIPTTRSRSPHAKAQGTR